MDSIIGIKGKDFVILAADKYIYSSIMRIKKEEKNKLLLIDDNKVLAIAGEHADRHQFGEYIRKNIHLYRLRSNIKLSPAASAQFARQQLAYFLRRNPYHCNLLLGGCDEEGAHLYWVDYLASSVAVNKGCHGYGGYFLEGLLDELYKEDIKEEEGINIIKKCKEELSSRFLLAQNDFIVKIINKEGIREIEI